MDTVFLRDVARVDADLVVIGEGGMGQVLQRVGFRLRVEVPALAMGVAGPDTDTVDTRPAIPALVTATADDDAQVRAWAAHALAEIGPGAAAAIPALITLLSDPNEGASQHQLSRAWSDGPGGR